MPQNALNHKDILNDLKGHICARSSGTVFTEQTKVLYRLGDTTGHRRRLEYYGAEPQGKT